MGAVERVVALGPILDALDGQEIGLERLGPDERAQAARDGGAGVVAGGAETDGGVGLSLGERFDEGSLGLIHANGSARAWRFVPAVTP